MRKITFCRFFWLALAGVVAFGYFGCKKKSDEISSVPTLSTTEISDSAKQTRIGGGRVNSDGGSSVTARGVCWSSLPQPTISGSHSSDGSGTGQFVSTLSGLSIGSVYYVRAYASNSKGTAYGNQVSFSTSLNPGFWLGQSYGGGKIFYLDGESGLIASSAVYSGKWSCYAFKFGTNQTALFTGAINTYKIANTDDTICPGLHTASVICRDYSSTNYTDWFLPSKDELTEMIKNRGFIDLYNDASNYWTSSDISDSQAFFGNFNTGIGINNKSLELAVRPIRVFHY